MSWPPSINSFLRYKKVLITGGTGYLGKAVVEKILRECSNVHSVYLLIRDKPGVTLKKRFQDFLDNEIFDWLKKEQPFALRKVRPIRGDLTLPRLGFTPLQERKLIKQVGVIIHCAATIKFDEKLSTAIKMNVIGTNEIIDFAKKLKNLKVLAHVSTAFANSEKMEIREEIYPSPLKPSHFIRVVQEMDEETINREFAYLLGEKPNTYTFTKAMAENLLAERAGDLQVCIVRPSIVTAAWKEPIVGWTDSLNNLTGVVAASGKGVLRTMLCDTDKVGDIVPIDYVVNTILAAVWYMGIQRRDVLMVYNCCSGNDNPVRWRSLEKLVLAEIRRNPFSTLLWYPGGSLKQNRRWNSLVALFVHDLPAYTIDLVTQWMGKKPVMKSIHAKIQRGLDPLQYFLLREWKFETKNTKELFSELCKKDKHRFNFDMNVIKWPKYVKRYCRGVRRHVLKDPDSTLPEARKQIRLLYWLDLSVQCVVVFVALLLAALCMMFLSQFTF